MAVPSIPLNFTVQSGNRQILVSWDLTSGATSYIVQRSLDDITFATVSTISGSPLAITYLDTSVSVNTVYFYKVAAVNSDGTGLYTTSASAISVPTGEMSLSQIRLAAKQRADRVESDFVTDPEWRNYINEAMFELYDLLVGANPDQHITTPVEFQTDGTTFLYPLPTGLNTFTSGIDGVTVFTPEPFYKLTGVDLKVSNAANAYVTVDKFNFIDRNKYIYPNTASTIYGVFNLRYRLVGTNKMEFIPSPQAGQFVRLWYIPRLTELLKETDTTNIGISGWIEYVIVRAAYLALVKEESPTQDLQDQIKLLTIRIQDSAINRDLGLPNTISDSRQRTRSSGGNGGYNGSFGGY